MITIAIISTVFWTVADYGNSLSIFKSNTSTAYENLKTPDSPNLHKARSGVWDETVSEKYNTAIPTNGKLRLIFKDDFNGTTLDSSIWSIVDESSGPNNELQAYDATCVAVNNGILELTAQTDSKGGYKSGKIDTKEKLELISGRIDVRMKLCKGQGLFPAIWLLHEGYDTNQYMEIDIMESLGHHPEMIYGVLHMRNNRNVREYSTFLVDTPLQYHVYSVEWDKSRVRWFVDGIQYHSVTMELPEPPMFLIINLAVGGNWPGSPAPETTFPSSIYVDYVHVYSFEGESI